MNRHVLRLCNAVLIAIAVHLASPVVADEAPEKPATLPRPGVWARYHVVAVDEAGNERPHRETLSWGVQEKDAQGRPCRWVEVRREREDNTLIELTRLLVPEEALLKDSNPLLQTVRQPQSLDGEQFSELDLFLAPLYAHAVLTCPGVKHETMALPEPKTVKYQHGDLLIAEEKTAQHTWTRQLKMVDVKIEIVSEFKYYVHPDVEAAFAEASVEVTRKHNGNVNSSRQVTYYLVDAGLKE